MKILSTKDAQSKRVVIILYGPAGHGKTFQVKLVEKPIVLSYEGGLSTISDTDIPYVDMTKSDDGKVLTNKQRIAKIGEVYKYLQTDEAKAKYKTVFIDSITEIGELIHSSIKAEVETEAKQKDKKPDNFKLWGDYFTQIYEFVKAFRDLPHYDVVFTCLASTGQDTDTGEQRVRINLPGNSAKDNIPGLIDYVFYLDKKTDKAGKEHRAFLTSDNGKYFAKNRSTEASPILTWEEGNIGKVIKKIRGAK